MARSVARPDAATGYPPVLWRLGLVAVGVIAIEAAVQRRWVNPFFLAPPTMAGRVLWTELVSGQVRHSSS